MSLLGFADRAPRQQRPGECDLMNVRLFPPKDIVLFLVDNPFALIAAFVTLAKYPTFPCAAFRTSAQAICYDEKLNETKMFRLWIEWPAVALWQEPPWETGRALPRVHQLL